MCKWMKSIALLAVVVAVAVSVFLIRNGERNVLIQQQRQHKQKQTESSGNETYIAMPNMLTASTKTTVGGCLNNTLPYIRNGGFRWLNETHVVIVALPFTNRTALLANLTCLQLTDRLVAHIEAASGDRVAAMSSSAHSGRITGVAWRLHHHVPFHALFWPNGLFGQHTLMTQLATSEGMPITTSHPPTLRIIFPEPVDSGENAIAQMHYSLLFRGVLPRVGLGPKRVFCSGGYILFFPLSTMRTLFWALPLGPTIKLARQRLEAKFGEPKLVRSDRIFVERRKFSQRERTFLQFRGYRPAVWDVIVRMAAQQHLMLDVVGMLKLSLRRQWNALRSSKYIIVSEGSFSVWVPFLRKGTICIMIYDHYHPSGWLIPKVHLPVAKLSEDTIKMVFISIFNQSIPTEQTFSSELLYNTTPQVKVVTVPFNETFQQELLCGSPGG
jgi:hypothetical protein